MGLPIRKKASMQTELLTIKPYSGQDAEPLVRLIVNRKSPKHLWCLILKPQVNDTQHPEYGIYPGGKLIGSINDCGIEENDLEIGYVLQANCVPSVVSKGKP